MLTKADDYPIHQLPTPVSEVGTERNFYDRYFFNGYSSDGEVFFATALCLYPNLNEDIFINKQKSKAFGP